METVSLQSLAVSAQGLGCMSMSEYYGHPDWDRATEAIHRALDLGVSLLDTADSYGAGHNEVLVGRAITGRRDDAVVATKFGVDRSAGDARQVVRGDPNYVRRSCEASLLRLGVDHIDLYYLHRPPQDVALEVTVAAMAELVEAGKVRHLGLSEVDDEQLRRACSVHQIAALQTEYSLWSRGVETMFPTMSELGVGLVSYSPLGRGFLTGLDPNSLPDNDSRRNHPRFQGDNAVANKRLVDAMAGVARDLEVSVGQLALAWVHERSRRGGQPIVPIPGTSRAQHVSDNVAALSLRLDDQVLAQLEPLSRQVAGSRHGVLQQTVQSS